MQEQQEEEELFRTAERAAEWRASDFNHQDLLCRLSACLSAGLPVRQGTMVQGLANTAWAFASANQLEETLFAARASE